MGNGARAQQKRERNAKDTKKGPTSQLKSNQAAKSIICKICRQDFQVTTKQPALIEHASSRHPGKAVTECFDGA
ncbi:uncharacterized protein AB675_9713 [Cyphellophora attinorum]|uniref:Uncharacterized protein n=1 Tax=Cyphellophora attinorum TaxID=1664694 RepID=A0A0N1P2D7_9EURO|nr:uncharacterized protein AB675_9713 [Phialophora attinorum]KPI42225.1 hypothetical protein AB675_9713 [Phialophora attinorum]